MIVDLAQNKSRYREQKYTEKADQQKRQHRRQNIKEKFKINSVCFAEHDLKAIVKALLRKGVGVDDLQNKLLFSELAVGVQRRVV